MGSIREIPASAVAIKVTNVSNPSCMKIYHKEAYTDRLDAISVKLRSQMKHKKRTRRSTKTQPQTGDVVIMHTDVDTELDLPVWWVRGIVGRASVESTRFNVFLVDLGYAVEATGDDFTIIPKNLIIDEHLTFSVGIYNLIPVSRDCDGSNIKVDSRLVNKWSDLAVRITRDLVTASSKLYFDYLAEDADGKKYGELYLVLDEEIASLSEILVRQEQAIFLSNDLLTVTSWRTDNPKNTITSVDGGAVVQLDKGVLDAPRNHRISIEDTGIEDDSKLQKRFFKGRKKMRYFGEECEQILIHSKVYSCDPLLSVEDARFPARIHEALRNLEIIALRKMQSYVWPAISKGLNVLAVGPPKCGKTTGYVLPVVSSIVSQETVTKGNNPAILILCSSTSDVLNTSFFCNELLEVYTDIRCVAGWNGRPDKSLVADIYNGCQILIATPSFLVRFLNQDEGHRRLVNFGNLTHLVIDGLDVILHKYYEPLRQLLSKNVKIGHKDSQSSAVREPQIVAVARHWSSLVRTFAKQCMTDPYVCIGSFMEAAIFGRVRPHLYFIPRDRKIEKITELMGDDFAMMKTMVICGNGKEARALGDRLSKTKNTLVVSEDMLFTEIHGVRECWKASVAGIYPVLICTDEILIDLNVTDIDWLIHYSVTLPSKTQFYFRFSTLMDNLRKGEEKCKVTIVVDETNDLQLYGVVSVVKNCGTKIPSKLMDNVMRITASLDREKKMYPICDAVKAFGVCPKKHSCPYRHCVLAEVDTPVTPIKIGDKVKLTVTYVHNATHFTARIMEYVSPSKEVTKYSAKEFTTIASMVQTYYADRRNRRCHRKTKVGDVCALEESLDNFQRVTVLNIVKQDSEGVPIAAELKCIDTGAILPTISVTRLMELPKDLANRDTHIVEVFLAGLVPYDEEYEWNIRAIDDALNWFPDKTKRNSFVLGTVRLHLANTLWVDPLEIHTPIIGYPNLINSSLKPHMLQLKHGEPNDEHLPKLYELCRFGGLMIDDGREIASAMTNISENESD